MGTVVIKGRQIQWKEIFESVSEASAFMVFVFFFKKELFGHLKNESRGILKLNNDILSRGSNLKMLTIGIGKMLTIGIGEM